METKDKDAVSTKKERMRSPSYPAVDLETAINLASQLYSETGRTSQNIDVILHTWGHNARSGHGLVKLASLIKFGLVVDKGSKDQRRAQLTELALTLVIDEEKNSNNYYQALKEAALSPAIHKDLWERYDGSIPSDNTLKLMLVKDLKFSERGVKEFIEQFRKTIEFAKLNKNVNIISEETKDKEDKKEILDQADSNQHSFSRESQMDKNKNEIVEETPNMRKIMDFPIPLSLNTGLILKHQFPMSEDEWEYMMEALKLYKNRIVQKGKKEEPKS